MSQVLRNACLLAAALGLSASARAATALAHASTAYADAKGAPLRYPEGVACDEAGRVVVADSANGRLVSFTFANGALLPGGEVKVAQLGYPVRLQLDGAGRVLALDQRARRIVRVTAAGAFDGFVELKGVPAARGLFPTAFRIDRAGNLYLLDAASSRVVVADAAGTFVRQLELPRGAVVVDLAVDGRGTVYALDGPAAALYSAPKGAAAFKPLGPSMREYASFPGYVVATERGLFVVDKNGDGLLELGPDGSFKGRQLSIGWTDGLVYYPGQVCITSRGEAFIADRNNHRVQAFTAVK